MRDLDPDHSGAVEKGSSRLARLKRGMSTALGAAIAVALLAALGTWFYRLGVRDADSVPIIRASAEPTKTRPEEPGGVATPYQEITSYSVADRGTPVAPASALAPPPPEPRREDVAMGTLAPEPASRPPAPPREAPRGASSSEELSGAAAGDQPAPGAGSPDVDEAEAMGTSAAVIGPETEADEIAALIRQATLDAATSPKPEPAGNLGTATDPLPGASGYAPPRSPVAPRRPPDLRARIQAAVRSAEESAGELARRAAESPVQIQLAADPDEQIVRAMWRRIAQANSDILHDRELAVQPTDSGGTTYYRLRVGPFSGTPEARAVCQALKARGQDCIVARNG